MTSRRHKRRCRPYVQSNICDINDGCVRRVYLDCRQIGVGALEDSNGNYFLSNSDGNLGSQRTYHVGNTNPDSCWNNSSHTCPCGIKNTPDATKNSAKLFFLLQNSAYYRRAVDKKPLTENGKSPADKKSSVGQIFRF